MKEKMVELIEITKEIRYYESLSKLFWFEQWQQLPSKGIPYRQEMSGYFSGKLAELLNTPRAVKLAAYFADVDLSTVSSDMERGLIRHYLHTFNNSNKVPVHLQVELDALCIECQNVWHEARGKGDYELFKPYLRKMFDKKLQIADTIDPNKHPYAVLANVFDEGLDIDEVTKLLEDLKIGLIDLLGKINKSSVQIDRSSILQPFDKRELQDFVKYITTLTGYDPNCGGYGEVLHPYCSLIGPRDARITTNYDNYSFAVFSAMHESGHGNYGVRSNDDVVAHGLWGGLPGGFHEYQARYYENMVGKSKELWTYAYPEAQKRFKQFQNVSFETYYKAISNVEPSLIRIQADQVTYNLHPIIRFEMEKGIMEGKLSMDDLPEVWNSKHQEYLGITPPNHTLGILQDVHWSMGCIAYFQSYSLGDLYGGQFRAAMAKEVPDVFNQMSKGNFDPMNNWIQENIQQYGRMYSPKEMVLKASGEPLSAKYFLEYMNEKYKDVYQL